MAEEEHGYRFTVVVERDEDGGYIASVPALPGCHTQGDTPEELQRNVKEAISLYLETMGTRIPPEYMEKDIIEVVV